MENRWKDFHSALPLAQVRLLYPPGIIPSPKVNISQQCLLCSTPHLPLKKKKRRGYWKEERFRGDRKWEKERNARKQKAGLQLVTANVLCQRVNQKLCLCVWSRRWRDVSLSDAPTPPSEMFIWTRAMNPGLLKGGWRGRRRRRRWRPAAPIIICGFGVRSTAYNEALDGPPDRVH